MKGFIKKNKVVVKSVLYFLVVALNHLLYLTTHLFKKNRNQRRVLIGCFQFNNFTGSELYVFELAKNLSNQNWQVFIVAKKTGKPLSNKARNHGIRVCKLKFAPRYLKFDIIHCQHKPITERLIELFPNTPKVCTIHSEIIDMENPVSHHTIKKYVAIRPTIKEKLIVTDKIPGEMIDIVYNPIDETRFNLNNSKDEGYTLFVGTLDNLRKKAIFDLVEYTRRENRLLWVVGKNYSTFLEELISYNNVRYFKETEDIEKYVINCRETAGILLGRTTIEGWFCGKPSLIYLVNKAGEILSKEKCNPPHNLDNYRSSVVTEQISSIYLKTIKDDTILLRHKA